MFDDSNIPLVRTSALDTPTFAHQESIARHDNWPLIRSCAFAVTGRLRPASFLHYLALMSYRTLLVTCLALVLVSRTLHCLATGVDLCVAARSTPADARPLADPNATDPNETGCICRGAVFVAPFVPAELERAPLVAPPVEREAVGQPLVSIRLERTILDDSGPPLGSGRKLRAQIASWQI